MLKNILVAEDEKELRLMIAKHLETAHYVVEVAADGNECMTKALVIKPDLLILDLNMPGMNGYEVMYQILQQPWGKELPIIIFSNLSDFSSKIKAYNAAKCTYLVKAQTSLAKLVETVEASVGPSTAEN